VCDKTIARIATCVDKLFLVLLNVVELQRWDLVLNDGLLLLWRLVPKAENDEQ
jgi:hypothetical protein